MGWAGSSVAPQLTQMPKLAESLKYLAKPSTRGDARTTENSHVSRWRQPMHKSRRPNQAQNQDQQFSRRRELLQIIRSIARTSRWSGYSADQTMSTNLPGLTQSLSDIRSGCDRMVDRLRGRSEERRGLAAPASAS